MRSKEQERSDFALQQLQPMIAGNHGGVDKDLSTFIVGTPTMILQNGLGQTMAFLLSKCDGKFNDNEKPSSDKFKYLFTFKAIAGWSNKINSSIGVSPEKFFSELSKIEQQDYLTLQEEALKMLQWLKRYAKAFQKG